LTHGIGTVSPLNLLGHAVLSALDPEVLAGNLGGDLIKGRLEGRFTEAVERGLRSHRAVDSYVDFHPAKAPLRACLEPEFRRYGDVMFDIASDQYLSTRWSEFADGTLSAFCEGAYAMLADLPPEVPEQLRRFGGRIAEYDLLQRGLGDNYLEESFSYLAKRAPSLKTAARELRRCSEQFEDGFGNIWPDLVEMVRGRESSAAPFARRIELL
jgi:acyl carrier protein phosphodiesterase